MVVNGLNETISIYLILLNLTFDLGPLQFIKYHNQVFVLLRRRVHLVMDWSSLSSDYCLSNIRNNM